LQRSEHVLFAVAPQSAGQLAAVSPVSQTPLPHFASQPVKFKLHGEQLILAQFSFLGNAL
jgi:hypothetical protein